jgi:hypothetical protein
MQTKTLVGRLKSSLTNDSKLEFLLDLILPVIITIITGIPMLISADSNYKCNHLARQNHHRISLRLPYQNHWSSIFGSFI